jgi:hypothetical protein
MKVEGDPIEIWNLWKLEGRRFKVDQHSDGLTVYEKIYKSIESQ